MNRPNPFLHQKQPESIIDLVISMEGPQATGGQQISDSEKSMAELQLFNQLYQTKALEKEDRIKMDQWKKQSVKGLIIANLLSGICNRLLTKLNYKRFDFMAASFLIRFPIRIGIFIFFNINIVSMQLINLFDLKEYLNQKYLPRYIEYMTLQTNPVTVMNKDFENDPEITDDEKQMYKKQNKMIEMQMKQMKGGI
jgi:hypothetical protein